MRPPLVLVDFQSTVDRGVARQMPDYADMLRTPRHRVQPEPRAPVNLMATPHDDPQAGFTPAHTSS